MEKPKVFLGIPTYGGMVHESLIEVGGAYASKQGLVHMKFSGSASILPYCFNIIYTHALNRRKDGVTHFAMLHDDIVPEYFWLDKLMDIMTKNDADIVSAVSPIKSAFGLTSTALDESVPDSGLPQQWRVKRLTLKEIHEKFEPTFTRPNLLVNTGCMLVDLRKPWVDKVHFRFENAIIEDPKKPGFLVPVVMPEDWLYSRDALAHGAKIYATREVKLYHQGKHSFSNGNWGTWETDQA